MVSPADDEASSLYPSTGGPSLEGMDALLKEYKDVFPKALPPGLPPDIRVAHRIESFSGAMPPANRTYRMSPAELDE